MLTLHDLTQIAHIVKSTSDSLEARLNSKLTILEARITNKLTRLIDSKIDTFAEQILEYTNTLRDTHETFLNNHEKRISKLEEHKGYHS